MGWRVGPIQVPGAATDSEGRRAGKAAHLAVADSPDAEADLIYEGWSGRHPRLAELPADLRA